jgi:hypothetical protein
VSEQQKPIPVVSENVKHRTPLTARIWKDYQIASNNFFTATTFSPITGWRAEIGQNGVWLSSQYRKTEGAAQEEVVKLANKRWPL